MNNCLTLVVLMFSAAMIPLPEQKGSDLIATVKKHGGNKQNEDWYGSERRGKCATCGATRRSNMMVWVKGKCLSG